jgi:hypothetical protein
VVLPDVRTTVLAWRRLSALWLQTRTLADVTLKRYAAKRDTNEREIVATLERCGCQVQPLSLSGMPDLLIAFRHRLYLVEIKTPHGKLTNAQQRKQLQGWPVVVVRSVFEALRFIGAEDAR